MRRIKNFIFDFDGPLFNAREIALSTVKELLDIYCGSITINSQEFELSSPEHVVNMLISKYDLNVNQKEEMLDFYYENVKVKELKADLRDGIREILMILKRKGCELFIVSDRTEQKLKDMLKRFEILELFTLVFGREKYGLKPSQGSAVYLKENLGIIPSKTIMIGDSDVDYIYAKNSGFFYANASYSMEKTSLLKKKYDFILMNEKDILLINEKK